MANNRELSQFGSFVNVNDGTTNIGIATGNSFVGIGTTLPQSKLDVIGHVRVSGAITATSFSGSGANLTKIPGIRWVTTNAGIHTLSNVGIGTTNPTSKLTVTGDVSITGVVTATRFNGGINPTGLTTFSSINVGTSGTIITVTESGLVGIGSTIPTSRLTVNGNILSTGIVTASSFIGNGSGLTNVFGTIGIATAGGFVGGAATTLDIRGPGVSTVTVSSGIATVNFVSVQGIQGTTGTQGIQGSQGIQGVQGTKGDTGIQGAQGPQGIQGLLGIQGSTGSGSQGIQGPQGIQGLLGVQGSVGASIQGTQGTQGIQGSVGSQGVQGSQGIQGVQGSQGIQGLLGIQGSQGIQGVQGSQGIQGLLGIQGSQGIQGNSASMQGPQGIQGSLGVQGTAGSVASQGTQGATGAQGATGTQGAQGRQGIQGIIGVQGTDGTQGTTGTGTQGAQGRQGIQGITGNGTQGSQGIQGTVGAGTQGAQGIQGSTGPSTVINAADDTTTATLYPVMVASTGSNQTAKAKSTSPTVTFNASTSKLTIPNATIRTLSVGGEFSATYTHNGTTVTISYTNHDVVAGDSVYITFSGTGGPTGYYRTTGATASTFTVTSTLSTVTTGSCTVKPENQIRFYGTDGDSPGTYANTVISERLYGATDKSELLIFKGLDATSTTKDNIRMAATGDIHFHSTAGTYNYSSYMTSFGANLSSSSMTISSGFVGIGSTVPRVALDVRGIVSGGTLRSNYAVNNTTNLPNVAIQDDGNVVTYLGGISGDKYCHGVANNGLGIYNLIVNTTDVVLQASNGDGVNRSLLLQSASGAVQTSQALIPRTDNSVSCGGNSNRWTTIHATNGTIQTSDEREKTNITTSNLGLNFVQKLNPVSYKWIVGTNEVIPNSDGESVSNVTINPIPGQRTHYGLIAQQVKQAYEECGATDFGGWILSDKDDPESSQGLRYDQFISPMIRAIQEQQEMIDALKQEVQDLKSQVNPA